jgi:hypothetical protein
VKGNIWFKAITPWVGGLRRYLDSRKLMYFAAIIQCTFGGISAGFPASYMNIFQQQVCCFPAVNGQVLSKEGPSFSGDNSAAVLAV